MSTPAKQIFDPLSASFADNPYQIYTVLREADEPYYFEHHDMWLLSRYDDVCAVATNPDMVRSLVGIETPEQAAERQRLANWHDMPFHERVVQFSLLDSDGDVHRRLRNLVFGTLTMRSVSNLEPTIRSFVEGLLDDLKHHEQIDFVADFAAHVPGFVIGQFLGVPAEDAAQLRKWSERIVQFFDVDRSDERKQIAETATHEFYDYLTDLKAARKKQPQQDLISKMIADEAVGLYSGDEFISTCMLILMAGHGSTIDVLGSGMHTLMKILTHCKSCAKTRRKFQWQFRRCFAMSHRFLFSIATQLTTFQFVAVFFLRARHLVCFTVRQIVIRLNLKTPMFSR